jgi:hypothetical protein
MLSHRVTSSSAFCCCKECYSFFTALMCHWSAMIFMSVLVCGFPQLYGTEVYDWCMVMFLLWTQYCVSVTFKFALSMSCLQFLWLFVWQICFYCLGVFLYLVMWTLFVVHYTSLYTLEILFPFRIIYYFIIFLNCRKWKLLSLLLLLLWNRKTVLKWLQV